GLAANDITVAAPAIAAALTPPIRLRMMSLLLSSVNMTNSAERGSCSHDVAPRYPGAGTIPGEDANNEPSPKHRRSNAAPPAPGCPARRPPSRHIAARLLGPDAVGPAAGACRRARGERGGSAGARRRAALPGSARSAGRRAVDVIKADASREKADDHDAGARDDARGRCRGEFPAARGQATAEGS